MDSTQDSNSNAFELHSELVGLIKHSKRSFVETGKLLYELKKSGAYKKAVGQGIDTWKDYIAQPEIGLSITEADRLLQIYEQFVVIFGYEGDFISKVPVKHLIYLLPICKKGDAAQVDELLNAAIELSTKDFKAHTDELKVKDTPLTYEYMIMMRCKETGSLVKLHEYSASDVDTMIQRFKDE